MLNTRHTPLLWKGRSPRLQRSFEDGTSAVLARRPTAQRIPSTARRPHEGCSCPGKPTACKRGRHSGSHYLLTYLLTYGTLDLVFGLIWFSALTHVARSDCLEGTMRLAVAICGLMLLMGGAHVLGRGRAQLSL
jgi:hypothetical protein